MDDSKVSWAEVVDVTRLIAADNEFENIDDAVFPDKKAEELETDGEEGSGNQFGGLELLDLHGNILASVPMGLRRLERLTTLNLAHNKLDNSALESISQITSLKELKLGHNNMSGNLPSSLCQLSNLEKLELQSNRLLSLPGALRELVCLKVLNLSGNQLTNLPMDAIQAIQLEELDASSNALMGSFFPLGASASHANLSALNLANNSLAALSFTETVDLPCVQEINLANNHLTTVPDVTHWTKLRTLVASENKITELPAGLTSLKVLRNINLTGNDIRLVDPHIGRMENLKEFVLAGNPLQQKKYLTMNCEDIKRDLQAKLQPDEQVTDSEDAEEVFVDAEEVPHVLGSRTRSSTAIMWTMKPGSVLDIASKGLSDDINDSLGSFLKDNEVRQLLFQQNRLTSIPPALWLGQDIRVLDLSGNALGFEYLSEDLELPALTELRLMQCRVNSLEPLTQSLKAPRLETLNVSANRLSGGLPVLRQVYPALTTLFAGENKFTSISADALRGFYTVNLSNNDLNSLPAEVGLLWDKGLKTFEVRGNAFRVPSYTVLERGTEAVMRWLMNKIPANEQAQ
ncbi:L domain-like protein [Polychaeton citri CBS 116435]|uniref:L domain-like protein n=1 Tax=Polychaeton citri CBS 116435 TaxID=1314669 RepID=A0A9P4URQ3_9PEZI|nr:L domain-like protein [Polychaeton citri CBS 116435]